MDFLIEELKVLHAHDPNKVFDFMEKFTRSEMERARSLPAEEQQQIQNDLLAIFERILRNVMLV